MCFLTSFNPPPPLTPTCCTTLNPLWPISECAMAYQLENTNVQWHTCCKTSVCYYIVAKTAVCNVIAVFKKTWLKKHQCATAKLVFKNTSMSRHTGWKSRVFYGIPSGKINCSWVLLYKHNTDTVTMRAAWLCQQT